MAKAIGDLRKKEVLIHDEEERTITIKLVGYSLLNIMKMGK